jgi:hypothetical protein
VSARFLGWPPAVLATLITVALVVGELTDAGQRRWWATRPLTTEGGSGDRDAASDGFRTYMLMLLTDAPVLINDPIARHFLEQAQYLGGQMARILAAIDKSPKGAAVPGDGLQDAVGQLQSAAAPLLQLLTPGVRDSIASIGQTAEE